jgi:hypothetical protein
MCRVFLGNPLQVVSRRADAEGMTIFTRDHPPAVAPAVAPAVTPPLSGQLAGPGPSSALVEHAAHVGNAVVAAVD